LKFLSEPKPGGGSEDVDDPMDGTESEEEVPPPAKRQFYIEIQTSKKRKRRTSGESDSDVPLLNKVGMSMT
jgi:hypothetical protein